MRTTTRWIRPNRMVVLDWKHRTRCCFPGEIHVWRIELDLEPLAYSVVEAVLSPDERRRAKCFIRDDLRRRWTVAHGALRMILAAYTGTPPGCLVFGTGPWGKPKLKGTASRIGFNLSHTGHLALIAISSEHEVGIDAETIRPNLDWRELSERFFASAEASEIKSLAPEIRIAAFFACWTRKEAFIKAIGRGLSMPLDSFRVTVRPDFPPRLVWLEGNQREPDKWSFEDMSESGVAAAVAVRHHSPSVHRYTFSVSSDQLRPRNSIVVRPSD